MWRNTVDDECRLPELGDNRRKDLSEYRKN